MRHADPACNAKGGPLARFGKQSLEGEPPASRLVGAVHLEGEAPGEPSPFGDVHFQYPARAEPRPPAESRPQLLGTFPRGTDSIRRRDASAAVAPNRSPQLHRSLGHRDGFAGRTVVLPFRLQKRGDHRSRPVLRAQFAVLIEKRFPPLEEGGDRRLEIRRLLHAGRSALEFARRPEAPRIPRGHTPKEHRAALFAVGLHIAGMVQAQHP